MLGEADTEHSEREQTSFSFCIQRRLKSSFMAWHPSSMTTQQPWLTKLLVRKLPTRRMLVDKTAGRIYLLALALIFAPLMFGAWHLIQFMPLSQSATGGEAAVIRVFDTAAATVIGFVALQVAVLGIRRLFHQNGGAVGWLFEAILGVFGCTTSPTFAQMHLLERQCVEFPELARVAGAWASQREDGLLDGTDITQLWSAGARLEAVKAKAQKIQRRLNRKRLTEKAKVKQRKVIARDMKGSGLAAAIETHRLAHALEVSTPEADGQDDGSRRL